MHLIGRTGIHLVEPNVDAGYITGFRFDVLVSGEPGEFEAAKLTVPPETGDEDLVATAGQVVVERLHIGLVVDVSHDRLFDACDACSDSWTKVYEAFLKEEGQGDDELGFYKSLPDLEECCQGDVLLIRELSLEKEYRGRGLEMMVAQVLIDTIGSGCDLAVFEYGDAEALAAINPMCFDPGPIPGFAFLNLRFKSPRVETVGFCEFGIVESEIEMNGPGGSA